jgi:tetratricopeptide (TPR) repeat protein
MGRFAKLDFEEEPRRPRPEPPANPWPDLDAQTCLEGAEEEFRKGFYERALLYYARALRFDRSLLPAWVGQARCYVELGRFSEAVTWAERGLEQLRDAPELLACKGLALVLSARVREGMEYLDGAVELQNASPWVWLARGECLLAAAQPEPNVRACFSKAMALASGDPYLELRIGMAYSRARKYFLARPPLLSALRRIGENPLAFYHLGRVSEGLGERREAAGWYERALTARPDFREAQEGLRRTRHVRPLAGLLRRLGVKHKT